MKFGAVKQSNGLYSIVECWPYKDKTYFIKDKLKSLGGKWNSKTKRWEDIKEEDLKLINASKEVKVRIEACCHEEEKDTYCFEHEIRDGGLGVSCSRCDTGMSSGMTAKVIKYYDS